MKNSINKKFKNKNFIEALKNAINGLIVAFKTESNIKIDFVATIFVVIACLIIKVTYLELLAIVLTIGLVIFAEMFNSVAENIVDMITEEYNERAKIIKDISAGAVLVTSITAIFVAAIIFVNKYIVFYGGM